jgi:hypothetical protein
MSHKYFSNLIFLITTGTAGFYLLTVLALWFIYSMGTMVAGGSYTMIQAQSLVFEMALVTTGLALLGVLIVRGFIGRKSAGKLAVAVSLATGFMLTLYTGLNVIWRNAWQPGSGRAQFLPPWDELNAKFFYEYNWLSYLLFLTPLAMMFSGCISLWVWQRVPSTGISKIRL